jgi:LemA protein
MQTPVIVVTLLFIVFLAAALWCILLYNRMVHLKNEVVKHWKVVEGLLATRQDALLDFVTFLRTTKLSHKESIDALSSVRSSYMSAQTNAAKCEVAHTLSHALLQCFSLQDVPLAKNESYVQKKKQLEQLQESIHVSCLAYDSAAASYNTASAQFPLSFIAQLVQFKREPVFASV